MADRPSEPVVIITVEDRFNFRLNQFTVCALYGMPLLSGMNYGIDQQLLGKNDIRAKRRPKCRNRSARKRSAFRMYSNMVGLAGAVLPQSSTRCQLPVSTLEIVL